MDLFARPDDEDALTERSCSLGSAFRPRRGAVWRIKVCLGEDPPKWLKGRYRQAIKKLVADDAASTLGALSELLTEAGCEVLTAADFDHGRRLVRRTTVCSSRTSRLGAHNGLHLAIRERLAHPHRPVIIITGLPDATREAEARHCGAEFLEKPIATAALLTSVRRLRGEPVVSATESR